MWRPAQLLIVLRAGRRRGASAGTPVSASRPDRRDPPRLRAGSAPAGAPDLAPEDCAGSPRVTSCSDARPGKALFAPLPRRVASCMLQVARRAGSLRRLAPAAQAFEISALLLKHAQARAAKQGVRTWLPRPASGPPCDRTAQSLKQTLHCFVLILRNFQSSISGLPVRVAAALASILLYGHLIPQQNQPHCIATPEWHPAATTLKPWQQAMLRITQPAVLSWQGMSRGHPPQLLAWVFWR